MDGGPLGGGLAKGGGPPNQLFKLKTNKKNKKVQGYSIMQKKPNPFLLTPSVYIKVRTYAYQNLNACIPSKFYIRLQISC